MEGIGVQDALCFRRQVGESRNESRREGCDCRMDLLRKSPGKEILLEVEKEKQNEHQAPSWQVYKWIFMRFNHKILVYPVALIQMAEQCYQWCLDQTSACFWACN